MLTLGPKVARFFETYLVHTKGDLFGQPFLLDPWQREFLNEAYRVDENGVRLYRQILLGIPRGNGKTPLAAGIGLFELMARKDAPEIYNLAGAKDQARELTDFATAFVQRGPDGKPGQLKRWLDTSKRSVSHKTQFGVMKLLSSAGSLQHGKSVSVFLADELHALETEDQVESYTAMITALHKRRNAFGMVITTAGFKKATLLGEMYDEAWDGRLEVEERLHIDGIGPALRIGRDVENGILAWWYGPPEQKLNGEPLTVEEAVANDELLVAVNPASWLSVDTIRKNLATLGMDDYAFARLHANMWTSTRDSFIPPVDLKKCRRPDIEPVRKKPVWVAVDIGLTHDTTAVTWSQPVLLEVNGETKRAVTTRARVWSANPAHESDRSARHKWMPDRVDLSEVEEFCLDLHRQFGIRELVFDPTFFEGEAQRLAKKGIRVAPIYQAGVLPEIAYQQFFQDVREGTALHGGDPVYVRHVLAAAATKTERGWRVSELRSGDVIDALQAGSMSHWRAGREGTSIYEERGLEVLGDQYEELDDDGDDWDD